MVVIKRLREQSLGFTAQSVTTFDGGSWVQEEDFFFFFSGWIHLS